MFIYWVAHGPCTHGRSVMKYCRLTLHQPDWMLHPMQRFIRDENVVTHEALVAWNVLSDSSVEYELFYAEVTDVDRYVAAIERVDSIRWYKASVVDDGSVYVFVCQETREEDVVFRQAFERLELIVVPPIVYDEDAAMNLTVVGDGSNLGTLVENMPAEITVTVERIGDYDRTYATLVERLTDRQFQALETATALGYYDVPRTASLSDVADALDCAESTASTLIRKGEASIVSRVVDR